MTISEIINPTFNMGIMEGHNPFAIYSPNHNPTGHSPGLLYYKDTNNPDGNVPVLNPEHYIHPLTGHYTTGPLNFQ